MDIKTSCLGVLACGPASGYEIRKAFEEGPFSHFAEGGFGSIYPALGKLTEQGLVTCHVTSQSGRPDKKTYEITSAGRKVLVQKLSAANPGEDKFKSNFLFTLFFAEEMPHDFLRDILDSRIEWYREKLDVMRGFGDGRADGKDLVRGFGIAVYQAAHDYLVAERDAFLDLRATGRSARADAAE